MKLVVVRHGQTEMNVKNATKDLIVCGRLDTPLTEKGISSAKSLRDNELLKDVDIVYSSDISRAYETAEHALPEYEIIKTDLLRERSLGVFEGQYVEELKRHPEYSKYFLDESLKPFRHGFGPRAPGGENYADCLARVDQFFERYIEQLDLTSKTTVAVFSHICLIRCILMHTLNLSPKEVLKLHIPNCRPIVLNYKKSRKSYKLVEPNIHELTYKK